MFSRIASDIDAKAFDLKAVNPNAVVKVDERTPTEIIANIKAQNKIVEIAMDKLRVII
jgi:type I restriction enzyme M protein